MKLRILGVIKFSNHLSLFVWVTFKYQSVSVRQVQLCNSYLVRKGVVNFVATSVELTYHRPNTRYNPNKLVIVRISKIFFCFGGTLGLHVASGIAGPDKDSRPP